MIYEIILRMEKLKWLPKKLENAIVTKYLGFGNKSCFFFFCFIIIIK